MYKSFLFNSHPPANIFYVSMENQLYQYLCLIFFIFLTIKLLTRRKQNLPPSPFSLPIIGHLHLLKTPLHEALATLLSKYGPILYLRVGSRRILVVSSPSAVEECFSKNDIIFANRPRTMAGDIFMYNQRAYVWASYGPLWRKPSPRQRCQSPLFVHGSKAFFRTRRRSRQHGTEMTAITMEWTMPLVLNHPVALEKVRAEIVSQVGHERLLKDSDLAQLPYRSDYIPRHRFCCLITPLKIVLWADTTYLKARC
ncbi:hypothetical protein GQ457_11G005680 [Hibiscus cannabinus]